MHLSQPGFIRCALLTFVHVWLASEAAQLPMARGSLEPHKAEAAAARASAVESAPPRRHAPDITTAIVAPSGEVDADREEDESMAMLQTGHHLATKASHHVVHLNRVFKKLQYFQDPVQCTIMGDAFDYAVQLLLFFICMGSLLLKWHVEIPQRRLLVFFLDISKQLVSASIFHLINMIFAVVAPNFVEVTTECEWYWVNLMFDNTFGLLITYILLRTSERVLGYKSGMYGEDGAQIDWDNKPDYNTWARQILLYCAITMTAKACSMTCVLTWSLSFARIGYVGTHWVTNGQLRLLWVMIVTPGIMNTFYFWTADEFLRHEVDAKLPAEARFPAQVVKAAKGSGQRAQSAPVM